MSRSLRGGTGPLHLLIEATEIKADSEGGVKRAQVWREQEMPVAQAPSGYERRQLNSNPYSRCIGRVIFWFARERSSSTICAVWLPSLASLSHEA